MSLGDFENIEDTNISRAIQINSESSTLKIPESLFEGIPKDGIATMYFARGNKKVLQKDGQEYFIRALVQEQLFIALK